MASSTGRNILYGIALGIVLGAAIGFVGGALNLPVAVRGGLTGGLVVLGFMVLRNRSLKVEERGR